MSNNKMRQKARQWWLENWPMLSHEAKLQAASNDPLGIIDVIGHESPTEEAELLIACVQHGGASLNADDLDALHDTIEAHWPSSGTARLVTHMIDNVSRVNDPDEEFDTMVRRCDREDVSAQPELYARAFSQLKHLSPEALADSCELYFNYVSELPDKEFQETLAGLQQPLVDFLDPSTKEHASALVQRLTAALEERRTQPVEDIDE
jgi:hypothetical protein